MAAECAERLGLQVREEVTFLQGFGGGVKAAHCTSNFQLAIDGIELNVKALVTLCDISDADLILGQPAIGESGVTMVVHEGLARFLRSSDGGEKSPELRETLETVLNSVTLEGANTRRRAVLSQDVAVAPGVMEMVGVIIEGAQPGEEVYLEHKVFGDGDGRNMVAIPSGVLCKWC